MGGLGANPGDFGFSLSGDQSFKIGNCIVGQFECNSGNFFRNIFKDTRNRIGLQAPHNINQIHGDAARDARATVGPAERSVSNGVGQKQ
jgi:hypothetical protein